MNVVTRCGEIKRLVMGLDRFNKTPCGFCFVEYYTHQDALDCLKYIGGTKLENRSRSRVRRRTAIWVCGSKSFCVCVCVCVEC